MDISFPNRVWDGQSGIRENALTNRPPDNLDWNRIIAELQATQAYLLALQATVNGLSGGGGGGVTSVGLSLPNIFTVSGSPITSSGTLAAAFVSANANLVLAGPASGPSATPTIRALVVADLPTSIPNSNLANSSITINSTPVSLGGSIDISGGGGTPAGSDAQVQINSGGSFAALRGNALVNDLNGLTDALAVGVDSYALGEQSAAIGYQAIASGDYCFALGYQNIAGDTPRACTISGTTITISGADYTDFFWTDDPSLTLSQLSGGTGLTIAYGTLADLTYDGSDTILTLTESITNHTSGFVNMHDDSQGCVSLGYATSATGFASYAEGQVTSASGEEAHAEGYSTTASGRYSHAEGNGTTASGSSSHAEGNGTTASTEYTHAEGVGSMASGSASHAEGHSTTASGSESHAEGWSTTASGDYSHAGGRQAEANRLAEWARGESNLGKVGHLIASGQTVDGSPTNLRVSSTDNQLTIGLNRCVTAFIMISGVKTDGSVAASFVRYCQITNISNVITISSPQTIGTDVNPNTWLVEIDADTPNVAFQIVITAEGTVNWIARIDFVEVIF